METPNQDPDRMDFDKKCSKCFVTKPLNDENFAIYNGKYRAECRPCGRAMARAWKANNKEKNKAITDEWKAKNKDHIREYNNKYDKERKAKDPVFKMITNMRSRMWDLLKKGKNIKYNNTIALLGCNGEFFKKWMEYQMDLDMTWANHGTEWASDHVYPCSKFDLSKPEHQKLCFNWSNYTPLSNAENSAKSAKIYKVRIIEQYKIADTFLENYDFDGVDPGIYLPNFESLAELLRTQ